MPVETPIMYDLADDAIRVHANLEKDSTRLGHKKKEDLCSDTPAVLVPLEYYLILS